jgi:hypothetical protein
MLQFTCHCDVIAGIMKWRRDTDTIVNGYRLYHGDPPVYGMEFKLARALFDDSTPMSYEEFYETFSENACSDWGKMDAHGECFGGFWDYPDNSIEKEHAYSLTFDANCRKLYQLPFSKRFILWTVEFACPRRLESVRYSNHMGVWFSRLSPCIPELDIHTDDPRTFDELDPLLFP